MDNSQLAQEWFDIAKIDLSSANHLLTMHPRPIEIICYHCQQSAEKYLKGFLVLNNHEVLKTHDLVILNKLCSEYYVEFKIIEDECLRLTDYSVNVRYPYPFDLNDEDMNLALKDAKQVKDFVLRISKDFINRQ
ncbi:MAG: HEPN domain-containing protein [candidate division KSB1 bacterium]|nr:HEPN domain-containing protein [candidate division KSB1 bacterium]